MKEGNQNKEKSLLSLISQATKSESRSNSEHQVKNLSQSVLGLLRYSWILLELLFFNLKGKKGWGEDGGKRKILPEKGEGLRRYSYGPMHFKVLAILMNICINFLLSSKMALKIKDILLRNLFKLTIA